ncbi:hypothetical protein [Amycolatopsis sp. NPDC050768]|uniref:NACHT domain-containing protein n=1 Tax=Amycolatopsis sp. NPDC050768 TaxID=3154839 RepID=UPI0033F9F6CC
MRDALQRRLTHAPAAKLFTRRTVGARWLVFIDGLDEITEAETRKEVIAAIAHQVRRNPDQRLVITTRPLEGGELRRLEDAGVTKYSIPPFGPDELTDFAHAWFRAQDPLTAPDRAREFIRQVSDGKLSGLVRNPLLATIAAIVATLNPGRPLPDSRVDLYTTFMQHLLDRSVGGRDTLAELRRRLGHQPQRMRLIEWLDEHPSRPHRAPGGVPTQIGQLPKDHSRELGRGTANGSTGGKNAAGRPAGQPLGPARGHRDLRADRDRPAISAPFVRRVPGRPVRAREVSADPTNLENWISRGLEQSTQSFMLFTSLSGTGEATIFAHLPSPHAITSVPDPGAGGVIRRRRGRR